MKGRIMENKQQESSGNLYLALIFLVALIVCVCIKFCGCERSEEQKKIREEEILEIFQVPMTQKSENRRIWLAEFNQSKKN